MGYSVSEWLFPIKPSPCADHRGRVSAFRMNKGLIKRLKQEAGLVEVRRRSGSGETGSTSGAEDHGTRKNMRRRTTRSRRKGEGEEGAAR